MHKIKYQNAKCKIKEVIPTKSGFCNFDFLFLIFNFSRMCSYSSAFELKVRLLYPESNLRAAL